MCGIAAIFAYQSGAPRVTRDEVIAMRDHMASRGPDGLGEWFSQDGRVGLGHRRLSIIDLSPTGAQPMFNADRSLAIVFNGEIYNYRELRAKLEQSGRQFASQSDTEVLLQLYEEHGEAMLADVRGMYAFTIWDARKRQLFLARDPFGIKPLYYADDGKTIRVASQVKALLAGGGINATPDSAGHVGFFLWGAVPDPITFYREISALSAGHTLSIREGGQRRARSFSFIPEILREAESHRKGSAIASEEKLGLLHRALRDSAKHHLVADVPVGVFLSAGLDSSSMTALVSESRSDVRTVTLGFREYCGREEDETPLAEVVAQNYNADHRTIWVTRDDFAEERENLFRAMDRPSIDGVNTYFLSLAAKRAGLKVALSGLGGDELFAGYPSFEQIPLLVRTMKHLHVPGWLGGLIRAVSSKLLCKFTSPKYAGIFEYGSDYPAAYLLRRSLFMPWELPSLLDPDLVREGWRRLNTFSQLAHLCDSLESARLKVSAMELCWYMRHQLLSDSDWAGMAHSLEIRVPYVDLKLLRTIAPLLAGANPPTKLDVARSLASALPSAILDRRKTGFAVPMREWLLARNGQRSEERGLRGWAKEVYSRFACLQWAERGSRTKRKDLGGKRLAVSQKTDPTRNFGKRILVFRIGQLGDTVVSLPAMWAIREKFPNAHIALLCDRHVRKGYVLASELLRGTGIFDEFLSYRVQGADEISRRGRMASLLAAIRRRGFDTLAYLAPSDRSPKQIERDRRFFSLAGIKHFIGMEGFQVLPAKEPGVPLPEMSFESRLLLDRLSASGISNVENPKMDLQLGHADEETVSVWLNRLDSDGDRVWLAVGPGSKMAAKRWPLDRFEQVIARLIEEFDVWPVVFGGFQDRAIGDRLIESWGRGYNAAGALGLRPAAAALKRCALFLGNDTGTMHMAAAVGVPCVAVFSSREWPGMWYPLGDGHRVFRSQIECEGCQLVECMERQNECLKRITAAEVLNACREILRLERENTEKPKLEQQCLSAQMG